MVEADLNEVAQTERRAYIYPWARSVFADCLKESSQCWVACLADAIVGHGVLSIGAGEAHLLNVCIDRDSQGKGYGRDFVKHMLSRARAAGADALFLEVRPSNHVADRLYDSMGFVQVGLRKDYYPSAFGREDARVLVMDLEAYFRCVGENGGAK